MWLGTNMPGLERNKIWCPWWDRCVSQIYWGIIDIVKELDQVVERARGGSSLWAKMKSVGWREGRNAFTEDAPVKRIGDQQVGMRAAFWSEGQEEPRQGSMKPLGVFTLKEWEPRVLRVQWELSVEGQGRADLEGPSRPWIWTLFLGDKDPLKDFHKESNMIRWEKDGLGCKAGGRERSQESKAVI